MIIIDTKVTIENTYQHKEYLMKQIHTKLISASLLVSMLVLGSSIPALAQHGTDATDDNSTANTSSETPKTTSTSGRSVDKPKSTARTATENEVEHTKAEDTTKAKQTLAEKKDARTAEQKHKLCENHKNGINTRVKRLVISSQNTQKRIDKIFTKAQAYQKNNNLQPADYDSLLATAQAAQSASSDAVAALKAAAPTVDCSNTQTSDSVAAFKTTAQQTREKLQVYRKAVKAVLQALQTANTANKTEGSQG